MSGSDEKEQDDMGLDTLVLAVCKVVVDVTISVLRVDLPPSYYQWRGGDAREESMTTTRATVTQ